MPTLNIPEEKVPQRRRSDRPESSRWGNQPRWWFPGLAAAAAIVIALFAINPDSEVWGLVYLVSFLAALAVMLGGTLVNYAVSNVSTSGKVYLQNHASLVFTDDGTARSSKSGFGRLMRES